MKDWHVKYLSRSLLVSTAIVIANITPAKVWSGPITSTGTNLNTNLDILVGRIVGGSNTEKVKDLPEIRQAIGKFQHRDHVGCLELLDQVKKKHRELPPGPLMLARMFLSANQLPQARVFLERAAVAVPEYPGTYLTFGVLALAEGRLTDAALHFEKSRSLPSVKERSGKQHQYVLIQSQKGLSAVAERRQDWKTAHAELTAWLKLEPKNGNVRQRLARVLFALGRQDDAYKELEQAVPENDELEPPAVTMAWLHERKGNHKKAEEWMQFSLKRSPQHPRVHQGYAAWLLERGRVAEAKTHVEAAVKFKADSRELQLLRGQIARSMQQYSQATDYFRAIHEESPADFVAANLLALSLAERKEDSSRKQALQLAEVNARQYPRAAEALSTLGWVHYRLGHLDRAEQALDAAIATGSASSETAYYMAHVMLDRGRLDVVKKLLQTAVNAPGLFLQRSACQSWLDRLSKSPSSQKDQ